MVVAVCIETPTRFARYTVSNATAIPLHTTMALIDPHACVATSTAAQPFAGFAWEEKTASDGLTEITVAKNGVWDITDCTAGGTVGAMVVVSGANLIRDAVAGDLLTGAIVGKREETASAAEVTRIRAGDIS